MRKFKPGKAMTVFVVFFFPVLLVLGAWQVNRGIEKQEIWEVHNFQKSQPVIDELEILGMNDSEALYRSVFLEGRFGEETYLLDNRTYRQEAGYEVFTIFRTAEKNSYLVNRGWVSKNKIDIKNETKESKSTSIEGIYSPFRRFGLDLSEAVVSSSWPKVVQELDFDIASFDLGLDLKRVVIQLSAASEHAYEPIWQPAEFNPSRHFGYAVQWFGLALVLIISFMYFGFKKEEDDFK